MDNKEIKLEDVFNDEKKHGVKKLIDKHKQETPEEEIKSIEERLRKIFAKDSITLIDVNLSNELLDRWKNLTNYVSDKTPVTFNAVDVILDKTPPWTKEEDLNSKC